MSKYFKLLLPAFVLLLFVSGVHAQNVIRPGTGINEITTAIEGASAGDIILLARGEYYFTQDQIDVNVNLTIMADEATTGPIPVISALVKEDGTVAQSIMEIRADVVMKNIYFSGKTSGRAGGKDSDRAITFLDTKGMRAEFDGLWFDGFDRRTVQLEAEAMKFYARNCIWTDDHKIEGPSEGRPIDLRQYGPDTVVVQNCSFVNTGNRWIRHVASSGKPIGYALIDHNTFVNGVNYHPGFDLGQIEKLIFTNNIVMDPGILGSDFVIRPSQNQGKFEIGLPENYYSSDLSLAAHRVREVYYDREDGITVFACHGVDTVGTKITMHHNYVNMDQSIIDKLATNDTLHVQAWMCQQFERAIVGGAENAFTVSDVVFTDAPPINLGDVDSYIGYWDQNPDTRMSPTAPDSIDLTYNTSDPAYTAAVGGFPLGDLNWFPDKYEEWKTYEGPKILWVSDGGPTDQPWVDLLAGQGYDVQREDVTMQGSSLSDDQKARLNTADLVIISRGTDSGSYKALDWNSIEVPLIVCNAQITRSSRWQWFNSTGTTSLVPPPAKIQDPSHPIFAGVTIPADSAVALFDSTTGQSVMFMDDPNQNNGNLLAKVGTLQAIVEWTDTTQVYNDATTEKPAAVRMFFGTSSEFVMTAEGEKVYLNAVEYMLTNPVTSSTSVESVQKELPNTFALSQNYPNPFNPTTSISYAIPNRSHVELKVFNVLGVEVASLVNEMQMPGNYTAKLDASKLSSGVYFYQLKSGDQKLTRKMMLMK